MQHCFLQAWASWFSLLKAPYTWRFSQLVTIVLMLVLATIFFSTMPSASEEFRSSEVMRTPISCLGLLVFTWILIPYYPWKVYRLHNLAIRKFLDSL